jgi:hypothetical protein
MEILTFVTNKKTTPRVLTPGWPRLKRGPILIDPPPLSQFIPFVKGIFKVLCKRVALLFDAFIEWSKRSNVIRF